MLVYFFYCALGFISGLFSGLFGIGGGVIIVPALSFIFIHFYGHQFWIMPLATGTSLGIMSIITFYSSISYYRFGHLNLNLVSKMMPGMMLGAITGVLMADTLPQYYVKISFVLFLIGMALNLWFAKAKKLPLELTIMLPSTIRLVLVTYLIGCLAGILGIGGGILLMPFLLFLHFPFAQARALTVTCAFPALLMGAITAVIVGLDNIELPKHAWGYIYWPATLCVGIVASLSIPLGMYLSHRVSVIALKRGFAILLVFIAWKMVMTEMSILSK